MKKLGKISLIILAILLISVSTLMFIFMNGMDDVMFKTDEVTKTLFDRVIQNQSLDVDIETGATVTSHAYLKAIENAVKGK